MNNPITLTLTPAQHQRLQWIIAYWIEMLNCNPTTATLEDEELEQIIGVEGDA